MIFVVNKTAEQAKFCFVELQNDKLASAAIPIFNGMEIFGRKMVVARPTGYIDPDAGPVLFHHFYVKFIQSVPNSISFPSVLKVQLNVTQVLRA